MEKKERVYNIDDYIYDQIRNSCYKKSSILGANYHHNSSYSDALSILENGILPIKKQNELKIKNISNNQLRLLDDTTSHINGIDGISLAVMGLTDLYSGEEEYIPYNPNLIDCIISEDIKAIRRTEHYGNEYVTYSNIEVSKIKAIDTRLIKLIEITKNKDENFYNDLILKYNTLLEMAKYIKLNELLIELREMSNESVLDINKLSIMPILKI